MEIGLEGRHYPLRRGEVGGEGMVLEMEGELWEWELEEGRGGVPVLPETGAEAGGVGVQNVEVAEGIEVRRIDGMQYTSLKIQHADCEHRVMYGHVQDAVA